MLGCGYLDPDCPFRHDVSCYLQNLFLRAAFLRPEKRKMAVLNNLSGVVRPGRMTLLLGPPAAGKSTLLKALAGKLAHNGGLQVGLPRRAPTAVLYMLHRRPVSSYTSARWYRQACPHL